MIRRPPRSPLFPYTTLSRSEPARTVIEPSPSARRRRAGGRGGRGGRGRVGDLGTLGALDAFCTVVFLELQRGASHAAPGDAARDQPLAAPGFQAHHAAAAGRDGLAVLVDGAGGHGAACHAQMPAVAGQAVAAHGFHVEAPVGGDVGPVAVAGAPGLPAGLVAVDADLFDLVLADTAQLAPDADAGHAHGLELANAPAGGPGVHAAVAGHAALLHIPQAALHHVDRKSTRLNSSHLVISYAVFCLKKKKKTATTNSTSRHLDVSLTTRRPSSRYSRSPYVLASTFSSSSIARSRIDCTRRRAATSQ